MGVRRWATGSLLIFVVGQSSLIHADVNQLPGSNVENERGSFNPVSMRVALVLVFNFLQQSTLRIQQLNRIIVNVPVPARMVLDRSQELTVRLKVVGHCAVKRPIQAHPVRLVYADRAAPGALPPRRSDSVLKRNLPEHRAFSVVPRPRNQCAIIIVAILSFGISVPLMKQQLVPVECHPLDWSAVVVQPLDRVRGQSAITVVDEILNRSSLACTMRDVVREQLVVIVSQFLRHFPVWTPDLFSAKRVGIIGRT